MFYIRVFAIIGFDGGANSMSEIRRLLPASGIRAIFNIASEMERRGEKVLHLEIGRPDWKLPPGVEDAAVDALRGGFVHYIANRGLLELREAVARDIKRRSGRDYDPESEIILTLGGSEAVCMAILAMIGPEDEVIVPLPSWPHYSPIVEMAGGCPVYVHCRVEDGFAYVPKDFRAAVTDRTRMIILSNPNNPTGTVQKRENLKEIVELAIEKDILILADEVYQDFVFEGEHVPLASLLEDKSHLIVVNSFSKSYAMTGWRIGWTATDARMSDAMNRIHQYLTVCGVSFAQKGVVGLLDDGRLSQYLAEMKEEFRRRYEVWRDAFRGLDCVTLVPPGGAFYLFPEIRIREMNARAFCEKCLREIKVAMVPGDVFGERYGRCVRISYGRDLETQKEAASRLINYIRKSA